MNNNPQSLLLAAIEKALLFCENGQRPKAEPLLTFAHNIVLEFPHILWNEPQIWKLAKAFLIMYHYDILEEEEKNFQLVQLSYLFAQRTIDLHEHDVNKSNSEGLFHALHTQVILLTSCADCFTDSIAQFYAKQENMSNEELIISERLANKVLPYVSYSLLVKIDDNFTDFNGDKYLAELCNTIEIENPTISDKLMTEAGRVHKLLVHSYLQKFKQIIT